MSRWIKKGDRVLVIAGNDKGKTGEVLSRVTQKVVVQGVNIRKKHLKPTQQAQGGRIIEMEVPIDVSNVSLCDKDGTRIKLKIKQATNGQRDLVHKKGAIGTVHRSVKKVKHV